MRILVVTEKYNPSCTERDGGFRVIESLKTVLGQKFTIMQFQKIETTFKNHFTYPVICKDRFMSRIKNANFIGQKINEVESNFTHIIFIHISMQFGYFQLKSSCLNIWTFPMLLSQSYIASTELIPEEYVNLERKTLKRCKNILTPSPLEKRLLVENYGVKEESIYMVPRGVSLNGDIIVRKYASQLELCTVGSIKSQKNILGTLSIFQKILIYYPGAKLKIIGPAQDLAYKEMVEKEIMNLELASLVQLIGYIPNEALSKVLREAHIHLSASLCETFGRVTFETLALGIPNIIFRKNNAAYDFLKENDYVQFVDNEDEVLEKVEYIVSNYTFLSELAKEIRFMYDDDFLSSRLLATILREDSLVVSDFDGTIFHHTDPVKTENCIRNFLKYKKRVICTARSVDSILAMLKKYNIKVDWIIAYSGAVVVNEVGKELFSIPLQRKFINTVNGLFPEINFIKYKNQIVQVKTQKGNIEIVGLRSENYENNTYIMDIRSSKLRAILKLLKHIEWKGKVEAFGDGRYDLEFLTYFDSIGKSLNSL